MKRIRNKIMAYGGLIKLIMIVTIILMIGTSSCSPAYTIETYNFSGSTGTLPLAVRAGAVSGSLYSLNDISVNSNSQTIIRRINSDNSLNWTKAVDSFYSRLKTLDVGLSEQTL